MQLARWIGLALIAAAAAAGCNRFTKADWAKFTGKSQPDKETSTGPLQVKVDGSTKLLSDGELAATKTADFFPVIKRLLSERRGKSARAFVEARPDVALEALRTKLADDVDANHWNFAAAVYDQQLGIAKDAGWRSLGDRRESPEVRAYAAARAKMLEALSSSSSLDQATESLRAAADATDNAMLELDHLKLRGTSLLVTESLEEAARVFSTACKTAARIDPHQEVQFSLLLSETLRRAGKIDEANRAWVDAVTHAAKLVARRPAVFDPVFWDRASYQRPIQTPWPPAALAALGPHAQLELPAPAEQLGPGEAEAIVWGAIGRELLQRGDHQAGLLALKRAETSTTVEGLRCWLRLGQAEALACLDQTPAAIAILVALSTSSDKRISLAATAFLGGIKLRHGDAATGHRLLTDALEKTAGIQWPARASAEADLGLAAILCGEEDKGLKWLHSAQSQFAAQGDVRNLSQSLWNEAAFHRQTKRKEQENEVLARLTSCESDDLMESVGIAGQKLLQRP